MKFVDTIKTDLTWLTVHGTEAELDRLIEWTKKHRTMYVIVGKRKEIIPEITFGQGAAASILARIKAKSKNEPREQQFGFKSASDALRCKLSLA